VASLACEEGVHRLGGKAAACAAAMRGSSVPADVRGFATWPRHGELGGFDKVLLEGSSEKARFRRKLLQPLQRGPAESSILAADDVAADDDALRASPAASPSGSPVSHRIGKPPKAPASRAVFVPPERLFAGAERPKTAERKGPRLGCVGFSSLRLRGPGEAAGPFGWSGPGDNMVLPLETQHVVRQLADALHGAADAGAPAAETHVTDGAELTVWAIAAQAEDGSCTLEPLAARRADSTPGSLAVEPVEMAVERQTTSELSSEVSAGPLRYGEGFRLRMAGGGLYLAHGSGALRWERRRAEMPRNSRFAAHGGELGTPVHFGRQLKLQRLSSPEPECESEPESSSDSAESESERLLRGHHRRLNEGRRPRPRTAPTPPGTRARRGVRDDASGTLRDSEAGTGLFSRIADAGATLPATFLPVD